MGHGGDLLTNVMVHCVVDPQIFTCSTSYVGRSKARITESKKKKFIPVRSMEYRSKYTVDIEINHDHRGISFGGWGGSILQPPMVMRMHTQGKSGWQYLVHKVWPCLGRLVDPRKGVDDEQQLLMCWGSTLRPFTARIATSNQILQPKISPGILASGFSYVLCTFFFEPSTLF